MKERIQRIEDRTGKLEISTSVLEAHLKNIDANVCSMKETWLWVGRTIIATCITGIAGILFILVKLGLNIH